MSNQTSLLQLQASISTSEMLSSEKNQASTSGSIFPSVDNTMPNGVPSNVAIGSRKTRRRRIPTSCIICRKRKIKCDKRRPHCSSCVKNLCTNLCSYQAFPRDKIPENEQQFSSALLNKQMDDLKKHNAALKMVVNNYEKLFAKLLTSKSNLGNQDLISSTLEDSSVLLAKTTFSFDNLTDDYNEFDDKIDENDDLTDDANDDDIMHDLVNSFDVLVLKEQHLIHFGSTSIMSVASNDPIIKDVFSRFLNLSDTKSDDMAIGQRKECVFFSSKNLAIQEFLKPMNKILPSQSIFKKLIDRFFEKCYMLFNFIEKDFFLEKMYQVTKSISFSNTVYFEVSEKEQLAMVGLTLLILRVSFLTLPLDSILLENNVPTEEQPWLVDDLTLECYREGVNISPKFVEYCKSCIIQGNIMSIVQLESVQILLALKYYKTQSPEDGDCGLDFTHTNAYVIQMAKMAGLNRDPDKFDIIRSQSVKHIWRKCWHALMMLDAIGSMEFGSDLIISENSFDTKLPIYESYMSPTEKKIIDIIHLENEAICILRKISTTMITVRTKPRYSHVIKCLVELKSFIDQRLPNYDDFANFEARIKSLPYDDRLSFYQRYCLKINMQVYYYILSYILMLTSGPTKPEMREQYLRITIGSALEIFYFSYRFVSDYDDLLFGKDLRNMAVSRIFLCSLKAYQMICIIVVRQYENFEETFTITGVNKNRYLSEQVIHWLTKNKQEISEVSGIPINDHNKIMSFQLYAYVEEVYARLIKLSNNFFLSWKFKKFVIMFVVYLLDKYPIYKEFSNNLYNRRQKLLYGFNPETNNNNSSNKNQFNASKEEYKNLCVSALKSTSDFNSHIKDVKLLEGLGEGGDYWYKMIDDAGRLKYNYFKPFFGDDFLENCEGDYSPPTDSNSSNPPSMNQKEYVNEPLKDVLIDDQTLEDINKYFADASNSLGIDLAQGTKVNLGNFSNNLDECTQSEFNNHSSGVSKNNMKLNNYNNSSIPSLVTPSSTGRNTSFSSDKRNQFDLTMDNDFSSLDHVQNMRAINSRGSVDSRGNSSKKANGFGFMFYGNKAPQSIDLNNDDESPSEVLTGVIRNQSSDNSGTNINIGDH